MRSARLLPLLAGFALCIAAYYPGLEGDFIFDDGPNIVENKRLQVDDVSAPGLLQAALSSDAGALKRPLSMLSFWLNYYTTGLDPFFFKVTNLVIHLLNGLALFWLTRLLVPKIRGRSEAGGSGNERDWIAAAVAAVWLLHPLNLTGVLYVVQRMTSLSATFVLLGLITYVIARLRLERGEPGFRLLLLGFVGFGTLATLSKENGVLLPLYMAAIELCLFRFVAHDARASARLKVFFLVTVAVPAAAALAFVLLDPDWLTSQYRDRDFSLVERLMTEARVLWIYLAWTFIPRRSDLGLFHDDIALSRGLFDPPTTSPAIVALVLLCAAAFRFRRRAPLLTFAVTWYLAGHLLESSFIGLELVFEHRNYLPIYGPVFAGLTFVAQAVGRFAPQMRFALPVAFALAAGAVTHARSYDWSDPNTLRMSFVQYHPDSARSNYEAGVALGRYVLARPDLAPEYYDRIEAYFERSASLDRSAINPLFALILLNATNGKTIDSMLLDRLASRLAEPPSSFKVTAAFRSLTQWLTEGLVELPSDEVLHLFNAALTNPTASKLTRATLLSILSTYYFNVAGRAQDAVSLALAAVEEDPTQPAHRIGLAELAIKLGNLELAARELDKLTQLDPFGRFALQREELAERLQVARSRHETNGQNSAGDVLAVIEDAK